MNANRIQVAAVGALLAATLNTTSTIKAQCEYEWRPGDGLLGADATVSVLTTWDPDGSGPQPALVVIGGSFTVAGNASANRIATWDGAAWGALGSGMNGSVTALTSFNGELIAGGYFTSAGGANVSNIARWNGTTWQPLGGGISGTVYALTVFNGELIAGGYFTSAGNAPARLCLKTVNFADNSPGRHGGRQA